ncbi:BON domain-containing protein [Aestuariivirga litoralis]
MAQNRDRNWQDRERQQRGGWQGEDGGFGEHAQQHGFDDQERREPFGSGQQQSGWQGGYGQQQGGEWNRMGRYGEEGWQGGGTGRFGQGGSHRMDRDHGQSSGGRGGWGSSSGSYGQGMNRPYVGEGSYGGSRGGQGAIDDGAGGYGSRGSYGSGSYGSGTYGTGSGSGYGSGHGYGSSGYGNAQGRQGGGERGFWERAGDEVSSWFGDDDARRRREMDEHRGRGPRGYTRSDDRIREDVNDRFTDDGWLDASDIEVKVASGEVTLTGQVTSREEKRRAEDLAEAISGVKHVQNNLRVKDRNATSAQGSTTQPAPGSGSGTSTLAGSRSSGA